MSEKEKIAAMRAIRMQARAYLQRAKTAGIPNKYMRIKKDIFVQLLCNDFHINPINVANFVYDQPESLLTVPVITIDGGTIESRKKAGFALLFRLIACDKFGIYKDVNDLSHKLQSIKSSGNISRNELSDLMKKYDVLFLSEFSQASFNPHFEAGSFFDEFLSARIDTEKPTIISFSEPIKQEESVLDSSIADVHCGRYLLSYSIKEYPNPHNASVNPSNDLLRIRVRKM